MTSSGEITPSQSGVPPEASSTEGLKNLSGGGDNINALLHAGVSNLAQLKELLIKYLGKKDGEKFYNQFMNSFAMIMLQQMQSSAKQAQSTEKN